MPKVLPVLGRMTAPILQSQPIGTPASVSRQEWLPPLPPLQFFDIAEQSAPSHVPVHVHLLVFTSQLKPKPRLPVLGPPTPLCPKELPQRAAPGR